MFRGLNTLVVAGALGAFAAGAVSAQTQPPTTTGSTAGSAQSSASQGQQDQQGQQGAAARERLLEARETLAEVAKMPEAAQLQGQARTEVAQAINNFNSLLTAESNWYDQYRMVMQNLYNVLGPAGAGEGASATSGSAGTSGSTGTSGSAGSAASGSATPAGNEQVPPALRGKLVEFRQKLMAFGREAGAPDVSGGVTGPGTAGTSGTTPPPSTSGSATSGTSGSTTTGSTAGSTTSATAGSSTSPYPQSGTSGSSSSSDPQSGTSAAAGETIEQHIDAIDDILQEVLSGAPGSGTAGTSGSTGSTTSGSTATSGSTSSTPGVVTIDREKLDRIQSHLQRVREIARAKGIK